MTATKSYTAAEYLESITETTARLSVMRMDDEQLGLAEEIGAMKGGQHARLLASIASTELCKRIGEQQAASKAVSTFATATLKAMRVQMDNARTHEHVEAIQRSAQVAYSLALDMMEQCANTRELQGAWDAFKSSHLNRLRGMFR